MKAVYVFMMFVHFVFQWFYYKIEMYAYKHNHFVLAMKAEMRSFPHQIKMFRYADKAGLMC